MISDSVHNEHIDQQQGRPGSDAPMIYKILPLHLAMLVQFNALHVLEWNVLLALSVLDNAGIHTLASGVVVPRHPHVTSW